MPHLGTHDQRFKAEGVKDLMTLEAFDMAWTQYQKMLLEKLTELTSGTDHHVLPHTY